MRRTIRLNESELRHMIVESVKRILREISTDTVDSATEKAKEKYKQYLNRYGDKDPRTQQAYSQYIKFKNKWDSEYNKGNIARQARMLTNREKRQSGERNYVNGTGWRNNNERTNSSEDKDLKNGYNVLNKQKGQRHVDSSCDDGDFLYMNGKVFILRGYIDNCGCGYHCMFDGSDFHLFGFIEISEEDYYENLYYATEQQRKLLLYKIKHEGLWWDEEDKYIKRGQTAIQPVGSV